MDWRPERPYEKVLWRSGPCRFSRRRALKERRRKNDIKAPTADASK